MPPPSWLRWSARLLRNMPWLMVVGERVSELADGRVAFRWSIPGGRGETHRIIEPLEFVAMRPADALHRRHQGARRARAHPDARGVVDGRYRGSARATVGRHELTQGAAR